MDAAIAPLGAIRQLERGCLKVGNRHHSICQRLGGELIRNQRGGKVAQMAVREGGQIAEFMQLIEFQGIKEESPSRAGSSAQLAVTEDRVFEVVLLVSEKGRDLPFSAFPPIGDR